MRRALIASVCALAAALAGCGGPSDDEQVRDTLARLERATATHDFRALCDRVFARALVRRLAEVGLPCPEALRRSVLGSVRDPGVEVRRVRIDGSRAFALVRTTASNQRPLVTTIQLTKESGSWRVAQLAGPQPPTPRSAAP